MSAYEGVLARTKSNMMIGVFHYLCSVTGESLVDPQELSADWSYLRSGAAQPRCFATPLTPFQPAVLMGPGEAAPV